jgi:hypothetical protein
VTKVFCPQWETEGVNSPLKHLFLSMRDRASFFFTKLYQKHAKKPGFPLDFAVDAWDYILYNRMVTFEKKLPPPNY